MAEKCFRCLKEIAKKDYYYGLHSTCFELWFQGKAGDFFKAFTPEEVLEDRDLQSDLVLINSSFFQGKYKKYSATFNDDKYIFKVNDVDFPVLQRAEYLSNQIAKILHIPVADFYLIAFEDQDCFVTKNFLYTSNYRKLTHIYHYLSKHSEFTVESLFRTIMDMTRRPKDAEVFLRVVLFDSLIGNNDRHGRNLGFLSKGTRHILSPIYDNCSYIGIEDEALVGADLNPLGKIATKHSENPSMTEYVEELIRLKQMEALHFFKRFCKLSKIFAQIDKSFLPIKFKKAYRCLIQKRHDEFIKIYGNLGI